MLLHLRLQRLKWRGIGAEHDAWRLVAPLVLQTPRAAAVSTLEQLVPKTSHFIDTHVAANQALGQKRLKGLIDEASASP
jgi:hypothetical protein